MKVPLFKPYQNYQIDTKGNVYGVDGRILKPGKNDKGYYNVNLCRNGKPKTKKVHRLVAQMFLPDFNEKLQVDHINHIRTDNRIENLRMVTNQQNQMNRIKQVNNTSGYKGITFDKKRRKWHAQIKHNQKCIHIGYFNDIEEAREAYNKKARELFGEYAYQEPKREKLKIKFIVNINITNSEVTINQSPNQNAQ